jgi:hypothetical protein
MRLQRRQYVLIGLIIVVGTFNVIRMRHQNSQPAPTPQTVTLAPQPRGTSPVWPAFDTAAGLRDAPDAQFQPPLQALNHGIDTNNVDAADLHGCQTWLLFYRAEHLHPTTKPGWLAQTQHHVDSCVANHRDIAQ